MRLSNYLCALLSAAILNPQTLAFSSYCISKSGVRVSTSCISSQVPFAAAPTRDEYSVQNEGPLFAHSPKLSIVAMSVLLQLALTFSLYPLPAQADIDISRGNELFTANCAGCHAGGNNYVKEQKNLKRDALTKFVSQTLDQTEVKDWVVKSGQHQRIVFFK